MRGWDLIRSDWQWLNNTPRVIRFWFNRCFTLPTSKHRENTGFFHAKKLSIIGRKLLDISKGVFFLSSRGNRVGVHVWVAQRTTHSFPLITEISSLVCRRGAFVFRSPLCRPCTRANNGGPAPGWCLLHRTRWSRPGAWGLPLRDTETVIVSNTGKKKIHCWHYFLKLVRESANIKTPVKKNYTWESACVELVLIHDDARDTAI